MPDDQAIIAAARARAEANLQEIRDTWLPCYAQMYADQDHKSLEPESSSAKVDRNMGRVDKHPKPAASNGDRHAGLPKIQKHWHDPTPQIRTSDLQPPQWYSSMPATNKRSLDKTKTGADVSLARLKDLISKCKKQLSAADFQAACNDVRERLHTLVFEEVNEALLRSRRVLHNHDGLPQIFDDRYSGGVSWPWDIKADAKEIYTKWAARQFDTDLLRGVIRGKPNKKGQDKEKSVDRLESNATERFGLMDNKTHGNGALLNGQWWPTQLTALRDGAHGHTIAGITGKPGEGAFSVILSGGLDPLGKPYPNVDNGDEILYCGTDSDNGMPSQGTQRLNESALNGEPVRVIRSHNLKNQYAPEIGFRYDGLYRLVNTETMDPPGSKRQRHRFKMVRIDGQDPLRGGDGPEKRPTGQEIEAYKKDQTLRS